MARTTPTSNRFFLALLPPQALQAEITAIKQDIWQRFGSKAALNAPPHITLQPPFEWPLDQVGVLNQHLAAFAQAQLPVPIVLEGYNAFAPRVIYVHVRQTNALIAIQAALRAYLDKCCGLNDRGSQTRPFIPHITVGFRDLKPAAFRQAWAEYGHRPFLAECVADTLTLLHHNGQQWQIASDFPFMQPPP